MRVEINKPESYCLTKYTPRFNHEVFLKKTHTLRETYSNLGSNINRIQAN